jgi:membrane protease YdiL (CAAX protease family)
MNFASWAPIFVIVIVVTVFSLGHLATNRVPYMPKWAWAVLIIVGMPIGGVVYIAVVIFGSGVQREDAEGRNIE